MIAKKNKGEELGYYGQKIVLEAQKLGLNTCWASGTYSKDADAYDIDRGEKLFAVIAVGYGTTNGNPHKSTTSSRAKTCPTGSPPARTRRCRHRPP